MLGRYNPRFESPECYVVAWTDTPADFDCTDPDNGSPGGICACAVCVGVSGTLVVTKRDGTDVTIPAGQLPNGGWWFGNIAALKSTSTAQNVMVFW